VAPDMRTLLIRSGFVVLLLATFFLDIQSASGPAPSAVCKKKRLFVAKHIIAWSAPPVGGPFFYKSGLAIDADGAPRAYHPNGRLGLDSLAHAGHRGHWWALVTNNGKTSGTPIVQSPTDPAPGFYVSTTALYDHDNPNPRDPRRYVDAENIPYVVLHPRALHYAQLGDFATVVNLRNGKVSAAIVADESTPGLRVGEGSIALAEALAIDSSPRDGGQEGDIVYVIYPGSGNGSPRELDEIRAESNQLFQAWGGLDRLCACLASK